MTTRVATPEGFLRAGAVLTRADPFDYLKSEIGLDGDGTVTIDRTLETLMHPSTIGGLRGASITLGYPEGSVTPDNFQSVVVGVEALRSRGCSRVALVGHSFGGAVVIAAAAFSPDVSAVVALSSQTHGAQGAPRVSPRPLLVVHGTADTRLPAWCAQRIYGWAREPKEIVLYQGAEHGLRECRDELHDLLGEWLPRRLEAA